MAVSDTRCLHSRQQSDGEDGAADTSAQVTDKLRCASQLGCAQAVSCSDDAVAALRRMLGGVAPPR